MIRHNGIEIDRIRQVIRHRGHTRLFSRSPVAGFRPVMFRTWEALILGDCTREELFNVLYAHDEDGGPNQGYNILNVRMSMWRSEFTRMELDWISDKRGGVAHWRLVPAKETVETRADRILVHVV